MSCCGDPPAHECARCGQIYDVKAMTYYTHRFVCRLCAVQLKEGRLGVGAYLADASRVVQGTFDWSGDA